jgi:hypothetical protein
MVGGAVGESGYLSSVPIGAWCGFARFLGRLEKRRPATQGSDRLAALDRMGEELGDCLVRVFILYALVERQVSPRRIRVFWSSIWQTPVSVRRNAGSAIAIQSLMKRRLLRITVAAAGPERRSQ